MEDINGFLFMWVVKKDMNVLYVVKGNILKNKMSLKKLVRW